jgi:hypothetical protein
MQTALAAQYTVRVSCFPSEHVAGWELRLATAPASQEYHRSTGGYQNLKSEVRFLLNSYHFCTILKLNQAWRLKSVILATREVDIQECWVPGQPRQKVHETLSLN